MLLLQAYSAMRCFLSKQYFKNHSDDIGAFCGTLQLCTGHDDWQINPQTWSPDAWGDWIDTVQAVLKTKKKITIDRMLTIEQTYDAMRLMLENYKNMIDSEDVAKLLQEMALDSQGKPVNQDLYNEWLQCVDDAVHDRLGYLDTGGVWKERVLSVQESLQAMIVFLKKLYSKKYSEVNELVQDLESLLYDIEKGIKSQDEWFYNLWLRVNKKIKELDDDIEKPLVDEDFLTVIGTFLVMHLLVQNYEDEETDWMKAILDDTRVDGKSYEALNESISDEWFTCVNAILNKDIDYYMKQKVG